MKPEWVPTHDSAEGVAKKAFVSGTMIIYVYPPEATMFTDCAGKWWASNRKNHDRYTQGTCTSLADGIAKAEAWLEEQERLLKPISAKDDSSPFKTEYTGEFVDSERTFRDRIIFGTTDMPDSLREQAQYCYGEDILRSQLDLAECLNKIREAHGVDEMGAANMRAKYAESVVAKAADIARYNAMVADSLNAPKARCEWLARELGLAPDAPEELLRAEVKARLADQWEAYHKRVNECEQMRDRLEDSQQRLERALHNIHRLESELLAAEKARKGK